MNRGRESGRSSPFRQWNRQSRSVESDMRGDQRRDRTAGESGAKEDEKLHDFEWSCVPGGRKFTIPPSNPDDLPLLNIDKQADKAMKRSRVCTPIEHVQESKRAHQRTPMRGGSVEEKKRSEADRKCQLQGTSEEERKMYELLPRLKLGEFSNEADIDSTKACVEQKTQFDKPEDKPSSKWTYVPGGRKVSVAPLDQYYLPLLHGDNAKKEKKIVTPRLRTPKTKNSPKKPFDRPKVGEFGSMPGSTNDVGQYSPNKQSSLGKKLKELVMEAETLNEWKAPTKFEQGIGELDKENIPELIDLTTDDSSGYDILPPAMAPIKSSVLQTQKKKLKRHVTVKRTGKSGVKSLQITVKPSETSRMPSVQSVSSAESFHVIPSVEQECAECIYKDRYGWDIMNVNEVEYIMYDVLGKGGMSTVYCAFNRRIKSFVAIKLVKTVKLGEAQIMNEVEILKSLENCDRIIKMHDYAKWPDQLVVVLEKGGADFGTIVKQHASTQTRFPNYMILFYWMEMLNAVKQIHSKGIIHTDLKPSNFVMNGGGLKLIDFGIACRVKDNMMFAYKSDQQGTLKYMSPEALKNLTDLYGDSTPKYKLHFKSDVWSLGCILYELVYGRSPFHRFNTVSNLVSVVVDPNHKIDYPLARRAPTSFVGTIKNCLQYDVEARPCVDELIKEYERKLLWNL